MLTDMSKLIFLIGFFCAVFFTGCNTTSQNTTFAPLEYNEAFKLGQMVEFSITHACMARTSGTSMEPVLTQNSSIIVGPIEFKDLELGMTVGYTKKDGYRALRQLIRRSGAEVWVATGINNTSEGRERVTEKNLLGVLCTVLYNDASEPIANQAIASLSLIDPSGYTYV
jgi:hypothetical protein